MSDGDYCLFKLQLAYQCWHLHLWKLNIGVLAIIMQIYTSVICIFFFIGMEGKKEDPKTPCFCKKEIVGVGAATHLSWITIWRKIPKEPTF